MPLQFEIEESCGRIPKYWTDTWLWEQGKGLELGEVRPVQGRAGTFYLQRTEFGFKLSTKGPTIVQVPHWGTTLWKELHEAAWAGELTREFLLSFESKIPPICACQSHWKKVRSQFTFTPESPRQWSVIVHNAVNQILGKDYLPYEHANLIYAKP